MTIEAGRLAWSRAKGLAEYTHGISHIPVVAPSLADRIVTHLVWRTDQGQPFFPSQVTDDLLPQARA